MLIESSMQLALGPFGKSFTRITLLMYKGGKKLSVVVIASTRSTSCSSFTLSIFSLPILFYTQSNFLLYGMIISCMNHSVSQLEPKSLESLSFGPLFLSFSLAHSLFRVYKRFNLAPGRLHLQLFLY